MNTQTSYTIIDTKTGKEFTAEKKFQVIGWAFAQLPAIHEGSHRMHFEQTEGLPDMEALVISHVEEGLCLRRRTFVITKTEVTEPYVPSAGAADPREVIGQV